jgi:hypothetical protein
MDLVKEMANTLLLSTDLLPNLANWESLEGHENRTETLEMLETCDLVVRVPEPEVISKSTVGQRWIIVSRLEEEATLSVEQAWKLEGRLQTEFLPLAAAGSWAFFQICSTSSQQ